MEKIDKSDSANYSTEKESFLWKEENQDKKSHSLKECGENADSLESAELESIKKLEGW